MTLYDLPTGYGAFFLYLLGGPKVRPGVGYMGGKWRLSPDIAEAMGVGPRLCPNRVVLADAGCPGWVWPEILEVKRAAKVAEVLWSWRHEGPVELWERLVKLPPATNQSERAAQVLWLQGRAASATPIQWSVERQRWEMATGARGGKRRGETFAATQKALVCRGNKWRGEYSAGLRSPITVARRIEAIARTCSRHNVTFYHGDLFDVLDAQAGDLVYLDPDYQGCTSYGFTVDRRRLLAVAEELSARGVLVAISEAVPLPPPGWWHLDLTRPGGKPEWLTMNREPARRQARLWGSVAPLTPPDTPSP